MLQEMPVMSSGGGGGSYELTNICTDQTTPSTVPANGTYDTGVPATANIVCVARNNYAGYAFWYIDENGTCTNYSPHSSNLWEVFVQNGTIWLKNGNSSAYGMAYDIYKIG